jgi:hypothetical protein
VSQRLGAPVTDEPFESGLAKAQWKRANEHAITQDELALVIANALLHRNGSARRPPSSQGLLRAEALLHRPMRPSVKSEPSGFLRTGLAGSTISVWF